MSTPGTYMPLTIGMRQEMAASDALATYESYQAELAEIAAKVDALRSIPLDDRDEERDRTYRMLLEDRQAIHRQINFLYREHAVSVALRDGRMLEQASTNPEPCPSTDHDGAIVTADRHIEAISFDDHISVARCAYCAEGLAARLLRDGYHVTIHATTAERTTDTITEGAI